MDNLLQWLDLPPEKWLERFGKLNERDARRLRDADAEIADEREKVRELDRELREWKTKRETERLNYPGDSKSYPPWIQANDRIVKFEAAIREANRHIERLEASKGELRQEIGRRLEPWIYLTGEPGPMNLAPWERSRLIPSEGKETP